MFIFDRVSFFFWYLICLMHLILWKKILTDKSDDCILSLKIIVERIEITRYQCHYTVSSTCNLSCNGIIFFQLEIVAKGSQPSGQRSSLTERSRSFTTSRLKWLTCEATPSSPPWEWRPPRRLPSRSGTRTTTPTPPLTRTSMFIIIKVMQCYNYKGDAMLYL